MRIVESTEPLTDAELSALKSAATWYAKYHARTIAERADDRSASALAQRERYQSLLLGLRKLGVRLRDPLADTAPAQEQPERKAA
ncbi:MAG: hypothetical protein ACR2OC_11955 [Solirubrobacterales bacterium]